MHDGRAYRDGTLKRFNERIRNIRSRMNNLFVFGDWRLEDIYSMYLMALFGGLCILFIIIDMQGGFAEDFDKIKTDHTMGK